MAFTGLAGGGAAEVAGGGGAAEVAGAGAAEVAGAGAGAAEVAGAGALVGSLAQLIPKVKLKTSNAASINMRTDNELTRFINIPPLLIILFGDVQ